MNSERAARWFRVSTELQSEDNQFAEVDAHVARHGYEVARTFTLPGVSASRGGQEPQLAELLADIRAGAYTVVVVAHSSRLDRRGDLDAQAMFLIDVRRAGGRVESAREPQFGTTDRIGRLLTYLSQDANAEYSRVLSAAVKAANARIDAADGFRGGRPPFGYTITGPKYAKRMEPDPVLAPVVRELFERTAAGQPVPVIREWLKRTRVWSVRTWPTDKTASAVTAMVRRPLYWTGRWEVAAHDGTTAVHKTEAIVRHELWLAANDALDARPSTNARPRLPRRDDFSGRLRCGECAAPAYRMFSGDHGRRTRSYYCKRCHRGWNADRADQLTDALMLADHSPELGTVIIPGSDHAGELARVRDELANLGRRNLDDDEHDRLQAELRAERDRLRDACEDDTPPRRVPGFTGRLMSEVWAAASHAEKCSILTGRDFLVVLLGRGRDVTVDRVWPGTEDD